MKKKGNEIVSEREFEALLPDFCLSFFFECRASKEQEKATETKI
jgi:hypothetical protein